MNRSQLYQQKRVELAHQINNGTSDKNHSFVTNNERLGYTAPGSVVSEKKFEIGAKVSLGEMTEEMRILTG
jgi:hypothetical protein